jgi:hypothetical protein
MNKKFLVLVVLLMVIGTLGLSEGVTVARRWASSGNIPDTLEAKEIMKTVEDAYNIESEAAYTFDLKKFPTVFINDPRFPVSPSTLQVVREMTNNLSLESAGYLDYKMAYYSHWGSGALLLEKLKEKSKSENRELTKEEKQSLTDSYGRPAAPRAEKGTRNNPVKIVSIEIIDEGIAVAKVDDGPTTSQLTLVFVDGKWYIAERIILSVHP